MKYNVFSSKAPQMPKPTKGTEFVNLVLSQATKPMQSPLLLMILSAVSRFCKTGKMTKNSIKWLIFEHKVVPRTPQTDSQYNKAKKNLCVFLSRLSPPFSLFRPYNSPFFPTKRQLVMRKQTSSTPSETTHPQHNKRSPRPATPPRILQPTPLKQQHPCSFP